MSVTVTTPSPGKSGWIINATSADASGQEELKAAVVGASILVDKLVINNGANAISITIIENDQTGSPVVNTSLIGAVAMAANSSLVFDFSGKGGMLLAENTALAVDASGAGAICIYAEGRFK